MFNFTWEKNRIKRNTPIGTSSLAKGFAHGPLSLHPFAKTLVSEDVIGKDINGGLIIIEESKLNESKASWIPRLLNTKSSLFHFVTHLFKLGNISLSYILKTYLYYI